jgi:hypothetical protein
MSEAGNVPLTGVSANQKPFTELRVTAHMMTLEPGLFCIVQTPSARRPEDASGLPGVRISLPPGAAARAQSVAITSFRPDGYLNGAADAALVRVTDGPAQILVTVYQAATGTDTAPRLQVLRLADEGQPARPVAGAAVAPGAPVGGGAAPPGQGQQRLLPDVVAHVQIRGDIGSGLGEWIGDRGSKRWIEGFAIAPQNGPIAPKDIEYQAVLGRGWLSPWVEGGQLCGSRGMALPILGLRLRLRGEAAEKFDCEYSATFTDGSAVGPVPGGESCEAESLAPIEAFQIVLRPRAKAGAAATRGTRGGAAAKPELAEVGAAPAKPEQRKTAARARPEPEPVGAGEGPKRGGAAAGRRPRT